MALWFMWVMARLLGNLKVTQQPIKLTNKVSARKAHALEKKESSDCLRSQQNTHPQTQSFQFNFFKKKFEKGTNTKYTCFQTTTELVVDLIVISQEAQD